MRICAIASSVSRISLADTVKAESSARAAMKLSPTFLMAIP